ncbi:MAG: DUF1330 domain-containing protein [Pseudomonadota bacterium]
MSATLVVTATPNTTDMEAVQSYLKGVMPLLMCAGGTLVKRLKVVQIVNGRPSGMVLVMDFPSEQAVEDLFASDAYEALIETRDKGFSEINMLIAGEM